MNRTGKRYTPEEVAVCFCAARFGNISVGTIAHAAACMQRDSIEMKVKNIVAMCQDFSICPTHPDFGRLSGTSNKHKSRNTDLELVRKFAAMPRSELEQIAKKVLG